MDRKNVVSEGDNVILKKGKNMKVYKVLKKQKVFLEKRHFALDPIIGHPYGSTWELQNTGLVAVSTAAAEPLNLAGQMDQGAADNRGIFDDETAQKLDKDDIMDLKDQGKTGQEIIDTLVKNSTSFEERTVYSKAKYLKKKQKKHLMQFVVLRPSTRLLCDLYFSKAPSKHVQIRVDSMAQMLTASNVQSGGRVMVMEHCQGLLVGAVLERMGGLGSVVQFHTEEQPIHTALQAYNFSRQSKDILQTFNLRDVHEHLIKMPDVKRTTEDNDVVEDRGGESKGQDNGESIKEDVVAMETDAADRGSERVSEESETKDVSSSDIAEKLEVSNKAEGGGESQAAEGGEIGVTPLGDNTAAANLPSGEAFVASSVESAPLSPKTLKRKQRDGERDERKRRRLESLVRTKETLMERNMDTLLIATKYHPAPILLALIDFLSLSRPFVVFSPYREALAECYVKLRDRGGVINLNVTETWHREYQVLPDRTHPTVMMNSAGGYILTGTLVGKG